MPKLPRINAKRLLRALAKRGFYIDHITGSHYILYLNDHSLPISIPFHNKDLKLGTLKNILKHAHISTEELIKLLNQKG